MLTPSFNDLVAKANLLGALLIERGEKIAVSESSTGGLIAASLVAVPGASAGPIAVSEFFGISDWPNSTATFDLGNRELIVIPIPGHTEDSITVYDPWTQFMLTGDSVYPGYIFVPDWDSFAYVNFIVAVEMRFGIRFGVAEIESFVTVGESAIRISELIDK